MKRILATIVIALLAVTQSWAQKGLQIDSLFNGSFRPDSTMSSTTVVGGSIKNYGLETFRSLKFNASDEDIKKVSSWVMADSKKASDVDIDIDKGHMIYALICLENGKSKRQYIGYQLKEFLDGTKSVTVVYMVGKTSKDQLLKFFGKRIAI